MNYHIIIENGETRYLKTKADKYVLGLLLEGFKEVHIKVREEGFACFLNNHGIECIYDGTFGYFNIDEELKTIKNNEGK